MIRPTLKPRLQLETALALSLRKALAALFCCACLASAGAARAQQSVHIPSLPGSEPSDAAISMPGFWFPAVGAVGKPAPAMVLMHGCGGPYDRGGSLGQRYRRMAAALNAMGIHALVTDSLTPRGERELCTQRLGSRRVTQLHRRRDALSALAWLAAQPNVDAKRLGLLGWSNGGSTVLASTNDEHPLVRGAAIRPAVAVAYYPGCEADLERSYAPAAPLLLLLGEADDWTPAAPCKALAEQAKLASGVAAPKVVAYEGAYHGFDGDAPLRVRNDVPRTGRSSAGVHVGANPKAREDSWVQLKAFLGQHFKL